MARPTEGTGRLFRKVTFQAGRRDLRPGSLGGGLVRLFTVAVVLILSLGFPLAAPCRDLAPQTPAHLAPLAPASHAVAEDPVPPTAAADVRKDATHAMSVSLYNDAINFLHAGQIDRAVETLQRSVEVDPQNVKALYALGSLLDEQGQSTEAVDRLSAAWALDNRHPKLAVNLGIALMNVGRLEDSEKMLRQGVAMEPHSPLPLNALGLLRERQRQYPAAADFFAQALTVDSRFSAAHVNLGLLALSQQETGPAEKEFLAAGASDADALDGLGVLRWFQGKMDEAESEFVQSLSVDRKNPSANYNMALYLSTRGRFEEARYYLDRIQGVRPVAGAALTLLGALDREEGQHVAALSALRKAVEQDPLSALAHELLGLAAMDVNDLDLAELHLKTAIDLDPNSATAHNNLGLVYQRRGKIGNSIEEVQRAAQADPTSADIQYNLAHLCDLDGRNALAVQHFKKYLELDPQASDAGDVRARVAQLAKKK